MRLPLPVQQSALRWQLVRLSARVLVVAAWPEARAHYVHEFKDEQRAVTVHFVDDPNAGTPNGPVSNFVIFTDLPKRDYFDWAAGLSAQFPYGISAYADYSAVAGEGSIRAHEIAFGLRIQRLAN